MVMSFNTTASSNQMQVITCSSEERKQKRKAGRKKFQETRHPIYKGVRRRNGKWVCELRQPQTKSRIWLGTFSCPDMAAKAHDVAALALKGDSAPLNFPETAHLLPQVKSSSIKDIQSAALEAAGHKNSTSNSSEVCVGEDCNERVFLDEEELFNMPALIDDMAEGLILTPPALKRGFSWNVYVDNEEIAMDLTLWSD